MLRQDTKSTKRKAIDGIASVAPGHIRQLEGRVRLALAAPPDVCKHAGETACLGVTLSGEWYDGSEHQSGDAVAVGG
jgi:hypothetical protein